MQQATTTVRVSRRTHRILSELAKHERRSVADLLDQMAERARRQRILDQYHQRMRELLTNSDEQAAWQQETALAEVRAAEIGDARTSPR
jgi:fructose-bisphosphate aldolase class 1